MLWYLAVIFYRFTMMQKSRGLLIQLFFMCLKKIQFKYINAYR